MISAIVYQLILAKSVKQKRKSKLLYRKVSLASSRISNGAILNALNVTKRWNPLFLSMISQSLLLKLIGRRFIVVTNLLNVSAKDLIGCSQSKDFRGSSQSKDVIQTYQRRGTRFTTHYDILE
ncbi:hypothetical protein QVD17_00221 [Tagetes erecta]|uniref:Uncharacterized protein n=1 Tax=Tagetes erecta TaxID=13708 RepID=A0AAD8P5N2_TARER|nr:hypothetical protein QVD17_00221 [Tagetes erecta]